MYVHDGVSLLSLSNFYFLLVRCLWYMIVKTFVFVDIWSYRQCLLSAAVPRESLGQPHSRQSTCCFTLAIFYSMQKQLRKCINNLWGLPCCCEKQGVVSQPC